MAEMREDPSGRGGKGELRTESVSPSEIQEYLKSLSYPANKDEILNCGKDNDAPARVISYLEKLPERQYFRATDVEKEVGEIKRKEKSIFRDRPQGPRRD